MTIEGTPARSRPAREGLRHVRAGGNHARGLHNEESTGSQFGFVCEGQCMQVCSGYTPEKRTAISKGQAPAPRWRRESLTTVCKY